MAGQWRNYRPIVIDGVRYRWQCDHDCSHLGGFIVRPEEDPQMLLDVEWSHALIKPALVRLCIELALEQGWMSEHRNLALTYQELLASGIAKR